MATPKKAAIVFEMAGKSLDYKDIEAAVKGVKGTKTAYVNTAEGVVYCVDANGETTKVTL